MEAVVTASAAEKGVVSGCEVVSRRWSQGQWSRIAGPVPEELPLAIYINGQEWVTIPCTPRNLICLVVGFLCSEGVISRREEINYLRVCAEEAVAEVRLSSPVTLPERRVLTSGCGQGSMFIPEKEKLPPIDGDLGINPSQVIALVGNLVTSAGLYRLSGGIHASALSDGERLLVLAEDIGRHNTLDKILGQCLLMGIPTKNRLLVTTGRISSEMVIKADRMAVPLIISLTSPTAYAIALAQQIGITLVGYARGTKFSVYTCPERIKATD